MIWGGKKRHLTQKTWKIINLKNWKINGLNLINWNLKYWKSLHKGPWKIRLAQALVRIPTEACFNKTLVEEWYSCHDKMEICYNEDLGAAKTLLPDVTTTYNLQQVCGVKGTGPPSMEFNTLFHMSLN